MILDIARRSLLVRALLNVVLPAVAVNELSVPSASAAGGERRPATVIYCATSLDGFLARSDGGLDWLPSPNPDSADDLGFEALQNSVDRIYMGRTSAALDPATCGSQMPCFLCVFCCTKRSPDAHHPSQERLMRSRQDSTAHGHIRSPWMSSLPRSPRFRNGCAERYTSPLRRRWNTCRRWPATALNVCMSTVAR